MYQAYEIMGETTEIINQAKEDRKNAYKEVGRIFQSVSCRQMIKEDGEK